MRSIFMWSPDFKKAIEAFIIDDGSAIVVSDPLTDQDRKNLAAAGIFEADVIIVKCGSKYEPVE